MTSERILTSGIFFWTWAEVPFGRSVIDQCIQKGVGPDDFKGPYQAERGSHLQMLI